MQSITVYFVIFRIISVHNTFPIISSPLVLFVCHTFSARCLLACNNKKHLKNVGPIRHCEPPHAALPFTRCHYCRVACRLRIDVHDDDDDDNDNVWQRGPLWPHGMGPITLFMWAHFLRIWWLVACSHVTSWLVAASNACCCWRLHSASSAIWSILREAASRGPSTLADILTCKL